MWIPMPALEVRIARGFQALSAKVDRRNMVASFCLFALFVPTATFARLFGFGKPRKPTTLEEPPTKPTGKKGPPPKTPPKK